MVWIALHGERQVDGESRRIGAVIINGHLACWFGWYAYFPNTLIYESGE